MMQTKKQKVEKFFVFFITKLGLLQSWGGILGDDGGEGDMRRLGGGVGLGAEPGSLMLFLSHRMIPPSTSPSVLSPSGPGMSSSIESNPITISSTRL